MRPSGSGNGLPGKRRDARPSLLSRYKNKIHSFGGSREANPAISKALSSVCPLHASYDRFANERLLTNCQRQQQYYKRDADHSGRAYKGCTHESHRQPTIGHNKSSARTKLEWQRDQDAYV